MSKIKEKENQFYEVSAVLNSLAVFTDQHALDAVVDQTDETLEESIDGFLGVLREHIKDLTSILTPENNHADR